MEEKKICRHCGRELDYLTTIIALGDKPALDLYKCPDDFNVEEFEIPAAIGNE